MLRSPVRRWTVAFVAGCVVLLLAAWTFALGPQHATNEAHRDELRAAETQTAILRARVEGLSSQFGAIDERRDQLAVKRQSLPADDALEDLIVTLQEAGDATGVSIDAVIPLEPVDITSVGTTPVSDAVATDDGAAQTETEAPAAPAAWPLFAIPVTIRASGSLADIQAFLAVVQEGQPRAILFTALTLRPSAGGRTLEPGVVLDAQTSVFVGPELAITAGGTQAP